MAANLFFGENQAIVDSYIKDAFAAHNKGKALNDVLVVAQNVIRHTDGSLTIVSRDAIF
jgi:hypothetical protein